MKLTYYLSISLLFATSTFAMLRIPCNKNRLARSTMLTQRAKTSTRKYNHIKFEKNDTLKEKLKKTGTNTFYGGLAGLACGAWTSWIVGNGIDVVNTALGNEDKDSKNTRKAIFHTVGLSTSYIIGGPAGILAFGGTITLEELNDQLKKKKK